MKPKSSENKAEDVETKPPIVMPREQPGFFALTETLRQEIIEALMTSSPKKLSVAEVIKIHRDLVQLRPISISNPPQEKDKEKPS